MSPAPPRGRWGLTQTLLSVALGGVAVFFSGLLVRGIFRYWHFRRIRPTALVTWPVRPSVGATFHVGVGIAAAISTGLNLSRSQPFYVVYSQGVMSLSLILMVALSARMNLGFYGEGVWSEGGFLPYSRIGRVAFRETPELVLLLLPRDGRGAIRLPVPPGEYGAVRRILGDKIRSEDVHLEEGILGL